MSSSAALIKRHEADMALMPPPPAKRIKRPATVLDEDEYTDALSDIISRDYFPGLAEAKAQEEYLSALESDNQPWIQEAGQRLRQAMTPAGNGKQRRNSRNTNFDTPRSWDKRTPVGDTPRGDLGTATPSSTVYDDDTEADPQESIVDTSQLSLSSFQNKYTSEDNESFNTVLDKQNTKARQKHAYLWTPDQRIPSNRLLTHRATETKLLEQKHEAETAAAKDGKALIPITVGAVPSRPAKPDSWQQKTPANNFMFTPSSVEEHGIPTIMEEKEARSRAGPKQTVYANTRFPPAFMVEDPGPVPPSPSLNTDIITQRDAARANRASSESTFEGGETPRVNGYSFVDEDEPEPEPVQEPTYRDLLAGQVGTSKPNPFTIHDQSKREDLHYRLVDKDNAKKRFKEKETGQNPSTAGKTPIIGNMTPAARKLMEKLNRTPVAPLKGGLNKMAGKNMWTPGATPRKR